MKNRIMLSTFQSQSEFVIAKGKLESEGIETLVQDELTVQSYNFLSNAIGGIKLFVAESDYLQARAILIEGGFLKEHSDSLSGFEKLITQKSFKTIFNWTLIILITLSLFVIIYLGLNMSKP